MKHYLVLMITDDGMYWPIVVEAKHASAAIGLAAMKLENNYLYDDSQIAAAEAMTVTDFLTHHAKGLLTQAITGETPFKLEPKEERDIFMLN